VASRCKQSTYLHHEHLHHGRSVWSACCRVAHAAAPDTMLPFRPLRFPSAGWGVFFPSSPAFGASAAMHQSSKRSSGVGMVHTHTRPITSHSELVPAANPFPPSATAPDCVVLVGVVTEGMDGDGSRVQPCSRAELEAMIPCTLAPSTPSSRLLCRKQRRALSAALGEHTPRPQPTHWRRRRC